MDRQKSTGDSRKGKWRVVRYTTYFINSNLLKLEKKNKFLKITMGLSTTKSDKKRQEATCDLCGMKNKSIKHILTSCRPLKHLNINRYNKILEIIERYLC
jgi:hypothetical protein